MEYGKFGNWPDVKATKHDSQETICDGVQTSSNCQLART